MALQNFQYDTIMREYSRRQSEVQRALEERRKEARSWTKQQLEARGFAVLLTAWLLSLRF